MLASMESLWVGSDVDLSVLHRCRMAERLEYRLSCLSSRRNKCQVAVEEQQQQTQADVDEEAAEECLRRRRRSGTWP